MIGCQRIYRLQQLHQLRLQEIHRNSSSYLFN